MKLAFQKHGSGKPLIILHGIFGSSVNWATVGRELAEHFAVYLVDLRNHGRSPHSEVFTHAAMAGDVAELIAGHGLAPSVVAGHSLGGKVAMRLAVTKPELVEKLIVADISPRPYPVPRDGVLEALHSLGLQATSSRQAADEALKASIPDDTTRRFLLQNLYRTENNRFAWRMNLEAIGKNRQEAGKGLESKKSYDGPTLFLRGERSDYIGSEDTAFIRLLFPAAVIKTIPGAGHWIHADRPEKFIKAVFDFCV